MGGSKRPIQTGPGTACSVCRVRSGVVVQLTDSLCQDALAFILNHFFLKKIRVSQYLSALMVYP